MSNVQVVCDTGCNVGLAAGTGRIQCPGLPERILAPAIASAEGGGSASSGAAGVVGGGGIGLRAQAVGVPGLDGVEVGPSPPSPVSSV